MMASMSASVIEVSLLRNTLSAPNLRASNSCSLPSCDKTRQVDPKTGAKEREEGERERGREGYTDQYIYRDNEIDGESKAK